MSLTSALAAGRHAAEARMLSTAIVRSKTGAMTTDADGFETPAWVVTQTAVPCRIAGTVRGQSPTRSIDIGGIEVQVATRIAHFPHDTTGLSDNAMIEVTDGELAGSVWRIVEADAAEQQTARRVPVIAADRPKEW